eukprot:7041024-Alexandrium_andersonii.AAC.1
MGLHKGLKLRKATERFEDHCHDPAYKQEIIRCGPRIGVFHGASAAVARNRSGKSVGGSAGRRSPTMAATWTPPTT